MQPESLVGQRVAVSAVALLAALVYGFAGARMSGCAEQSAAARFAVAAGALTLMGLSLSA